jgi:hypothetical protein
MPAYWVEDAGSLQGNYDDVEILIFQEGPDTYYAEMKSAIGRSCGKELPALPEKKWEDLDDAHEYGAQVFQWLLPPKSELETAFLKARWNAEGSAAPRKLRVRLWLDPEADALHRIWWEAMFDPHRDSQIALATALSRFVTSDAPPALPVAQRPLRMLLVSSNPDGLKEFGCAPLNLYFEQDVVRRATRGLGESLDIQQLVNPSRESLSTSLEEFQPHIIYIQAHAIYSDPQGEMLLAGNNETVAPVSFKEVVAIITRSGKVPPHLVFLALPSTARPDFRYSLSTLARPLVESGVQASVALHAPIEEEKLVEFATQFFSVLTRQGVIDEAVASARRRIHEPYNKKDWTFTYPVLYMRTADAVLFQPLPPEVEEGLRFLSGRFQGGA